MLHLWSYQWDLADTHDPRHFTGRGRGRKYTADDARAFRKRVARRRARKGYR